MANAWYKKKRKLKEFLPPWYETPRQDPLEGFKQLMALAEVSDADDQHVDG